MPVKIIALVTVEEGNEAAFTEAALSCVAASRREPGVIHYDLWRETEGERRFVFNELYKDQAAVAHHMASSHFAAIGLASRELATAPPELITTTEIDVV